jgi:BirA family biotin operon repressor/biotin-[acetyl-CoA-carboxylase] ligase
MGPMVAHEEAPAHSSIDLRAGCESIGDLSHEINRLWLWSSLPRGQSWYDVRPRRHGCRNGECVEHSSRQALTADSIAEGLPSAAWHRAVALTTTASTQDVLRALLEASAATDGRWQLVAADHQSAGRGRSGSAWLAAPGSAVLMSIGGRVPLAAAWWPRLSLVAGLAAVEWLASVTGLHRELRLKWPNDVLAQTPSGWRKLAGLLGERHDLRHEAVWLCGIGLNVHGPLAAAIQSHAAALEDLTTLRLTRGQLCSGLGRAIRREVEAFCASGGQLETARWQPWLAFAGDDVQLDLAAGGLRWMHLVGVDGSGGLCVRDSGSPQERTQVVQPLAITAARHSGCSEPYWQAAPKT